MDNPFGNIDTDKAKIPLQKREEGVVKKKKVGRPKRPNMVPYLIKMDKALHARLVQFAQEYGMNKSAVITKAVRDLMDSSN